MFPLPPGEQPPYAGVLPVTFDHDENVRKQPNSAATGASAAGVRAFSSQLVAFYFRAPAKAFFRTRVDYMAIARAMHPGTPSGSWWSWRTTTPGLLAHAVNVQGWRFIPDQVLPPLIANTFVGAVLYTSYLQLLGILHEPSSKSLKHVNPPPGLHQTFSAGFLAGAVQSVVAAPLDAIQVRFDTNEMIGGHYRNMWQYAKEKLKDIGPRGVSAGWSLSFLKDSFGFGVFFATFEYVKAQGYYGFVAKYYGSLQPQWIERLSLPEDSQENGVPVIKPHWALEPCFLGAAGVLASVMQAVIQYPLGHIQSFHYERLEQLDFQARQIQSRRQMMQHYYNAYHETLRQCQKEARRVGNWRGWLFKDFFKTTIRQTPSTALGLIIFELVRRKYGDGETVRISKDGYEILLS